jgi:Ca2+-binding EF-hand superfamily protein
MFTRVLPLLRRALTASAVPAVVYVGSQVVLPERQSMWSRPILADQAAPSKILSDAERLYRARIRALSTPEKVFAVFASVHDGKHHYMELNDFLSSLLPLFASSSNSDKNIKSSHYFKQFDVDGNGLIDFSEYLFFLTLLSIPSSQFAVAFAALDTDGSGSLSKDEFLSLLKDIRRNAENVFSTPTARQDGPDNAGVLPEGIIQVLFGADGKRPLSRKEFTNVFNSLRQELRKLEFQSLADKGAISGRTFAESLICYCTPNKLEKYQKRLETLPPHLADARLTEEEFLGFNAAIDQIAQAVPTLSVFQKSGSECISADALARVIKLSTGFPLSTRAAEILVHVFRESEKACPNFRSMSRVLLQRSSFGLGTYRDTGFSRFAKCVARCGSDSVDGIINNS